MASVTRYRAFAFLVSIPDTTPIAGAAPNRLGFGAISPAAGTIIARA